MKTFIFSWRRLCALSTIVALAACSSTPVATTSPAGTEPARLAADGWGNTPLPLGAEINHKDSLILGSGEQWVGRLVLDVGRDAEKAFKYFNETYPGRGWNLVTSVRGDTSLLVFANAERSLSIEIRSGQFWGGGNAVITATPHRMGTGTGMGMGMGSPPARGNPAPAQRP